jgi:hypothetical protein
MGTEIRRNLVNLLCSADLLMVLLRFYALSAEEGLAVCYAAGLLPLLKRPFGLA